MMLAGRVLALGCSRSAVLGFSLGTSTVVAPNTHRVITPCMTYATIKSKSKSKPIPKPTPKKPNTASKQPNQQKGDDQPKGTNLKVTKEVKGDVKSLSQKKKKGAESNPADAPQKTNLPSVVFKRRRKKRATTSTMARAAKAYSRNQRRLAGDRSVGKITPEDEVLIEMYEQTEGHTIQVTREEFSATPEELSFEQLYRRILRSFEDHRLPQRELLFEMLNKSKSQEDWDNFVIIAKVYQSKLLMMKPHHASHIVHLAVSKGFTNQLFDEMQKNILYLYPSKSGYHKLIAELAKADQQDKVWKILHLMAERGIVPLRETFNTLFEQSKEKDIDAALKFFKTGSGLGLRSVGIEAYALGRKLASLDRWNDVLEVEKIVKKDYPNKEFRKLIPLIFLNAHIQTGDKDALIQLTLEEIAALKEDIKQLDEADKQAYPFVSKLGEAVPQLASA